MIQAMTSGHAGSMSTLHAATPFDALQRLETMALMSGVELPLFALRNQIGSAIQVIVQISRLQDGQRRVTEIAEVLPLSDDNRYRLQPIFVVRPIIEKGINKGLDLEWTGKTSLLAADPKIALLADSLKRTNRIMGLPERVEKTAG